jgi:hypothetical protein
MKYIKLFEISKKDVENYIDEYNIQTAMDILKNFYGNFFGDIRLRKVGNRAKKPSSHWWDCPDNYIIDIRVCNLIKTYAPDKDHNRPNPIIQFIGYSPEMRAQHPEFLEVQMNLKLYFENLLSDVVFNTHENIFIADLEGAAEIIIDNEDNLTTENFELFCSAKKYNL